ncbi:MAG: phosphatidate cytidylyltransferase [Flavobacteriaceae bacterium]|jgi:phosphatidate cytidylyltransferase|uniref:phosphatidate cytidylyltransferase n=1 Tax=Candidatus Marifrigoribacter sp. Uisw_064 TaxID=3230970 RepID=UPI003AEAB36A
MKEFIVRAISGILYVSIIIFTLFTPREWFIGLFFILALITLNEFLKLHKSKGYFYYIILFLLFYFISYQLYHNYAIYALLIATISINLFLLIDLYAAEKKHFIKEKKLLGSIFYISSGFVFLTLIPLINLQFIPEILISIFILIWANDTFAYLIGKSIGKRKLMERISPKKTIEGFIGGLVGAILTSLVIFYCTEYYSAYIWIAIAILITVFGTLGDLIQSKFKRIAGVKDSGKLMPGHGGIYDRLDSIIYSSPFIYLFLQIINYAS